ncbi:Protein of unknown function [Pyronema omphalodes CBS 100304]|uniref:Uncharacterized protein n=1 Tax=Pyronema omphalodes (strain CBS 100304) TaxID=1076935 RepID=U4LKU7_PYROM|nr:Protein of unknown function [Pyronema omphalodes CBS 100304]
MSDLPLDETSFHIRPAVPNGSCLLPVAFRDAGKSVPDFISFAFTRRPVPPTTDRSACWATLLSAYDVTNAPRRD